MKRKQRQLRNQKADKEPIIIVSGLPRSGTSMLMRMLEFGGVPLVVDHARAADSDNPLGYYEDQRVKDLRSNNQWLGQVSGKAVKIISLLLYQLPLLSRCKVIFIQRRMAEILVSQKKMLAAKGQKVDGIDDRTMAKKLNRHLQEVKGWLADQKNTDTLYLEYHEVVADPLTHAAKIGDFLDMDLNTYAMAKAVDGSLYRNRAG